MSRMHEIIGASVATAVAVSVLGGCVAQKEFTVRDEVGNPNAVLIARGGTLLARIMCSPDDSGAIGNVFGSVADYRSAQQVEQTGLANPCKDGMVEPAEYDTLPPLAAKLGWIKK